MKFSIVIPTYNRASLIEKTIKSLLSQTYRDFEILVIDDGSTDNTAAVIQSISDKRVNYYKKENAERGAARNYGAQLAKGDYINFFDSDDVAYPNHLATANKLIDSNPDVFHLGYDIKNVDGTITRIPTKITDINKQIIGGNLLSCNGVFIKSTIAKSYPFSEERILSASEDYLLWLQLAAVFKFEYNNTVTSTIINHEQRSVIAINKESLIARQELFLNKALADKNIKSSYAKYFPKLKAEVYSYIALHLALSDEKQTAISYFKNAIKSDVSFVLRRRFLAIIKHLLL